MMRIVSLGVLVFAVGFALIGCGSNKEPPKPDMPMKPTIEPGKAPKTKTMEAEFRDPPKK